MAKLSMSYFYTVASQLAKRSFQIIGKVVNFYPMLLELMIFLSNFRVYLLKIIQGQERLVDGLSLAALSEELPALSVVNRITS